jgi:hypothetical protein
MARRRIGQERLRLSDGEGRRTSSLDTGSLFSGDAGPPGTQPTKSSEG